MFPQLPKPPQKVKQWPKTSKKSCYSTYFRVPQLGGSQERSTGAGSAGGTAEEAQEAQHRRMRRSPKTLKPETLNLNRFRLGFRDLGSGFEVCGFRLGLYSRMFWCAPGLSAFLGSWVYSEPLPNHRTAAGK